MKLNSDVVKLILVMLEVKLPLRVTVGRLLRITVWLEEYAPTARSEKKKSNNITEMRCTT